jgi:hypothetical protein
MYANKLSRMSAMAALASSGFSILAAPVAIAGSLVPVLPDLVLMALLLATDLLIFLALTGLYCAQAEETGTAGLIGFILAEVGLAVTPFLAPVGYPLFLAGLLLLAAASSGASVLPAGAMWVWFAGALVSVSTGILGLGIPLVGRGWVLDRTRPVEPMISVSGRSILPVPGTRSQSYPWSG